MLQRFDGHTTTFIDTVHGVDATVHIDGEQLEKVDADVGCARALSLDDELRTAERHVLLSRLLVDTHAVSHGRDVHIVVVERGIGGTSANGIEGLVPDLLRGLLIETEGKLRLYVAGILANAHAVVQEHVGLLGVFAATSTHDDTSIDGGAAILDQRPERLDVFVGLFIRQTTSL